MKCGPYTQVVFICRFNNMESIPWGPVKCDVYISRWSLYTGGRLSRFWVYSDRGSVTTPYVIYIYIYIYIYIHSICHIYIYGWHDLILIICVTWYDMCQWHNLGSWSLAWPVMTRVSDSTFGGVTDTYVSYLVTQRAEIKSGVAKKRRKEPRSIVVSPTCALPDHAKNRDK